MNKAFCNGCRNDFYNDKNPYGIKECWSLKTAKVVWRIPVGHWEDPPYLNKKKVQVANCWQGEGSNRTHYVEPERITPEGYWK